jgi:plastocyanin
LEEQGGNVENPKTVKVWIFQKRNGQLRVDPSPVVVRQGDTISWINISGVAGARAEFEEGVIKEGTGVDIPDDCRKAGAATVIGKAGTYFEYELPFENGQYAEGNSKPGGIIDP